jgi:FHA domain
MKIRMHVQDGSRNFDFDHAGPSVALGRNPAGDVVLEEEAAESVVSWEHARIDLSPREATLTDLRSTNGTYRNGTSVSGTVPLWPNDVVRLGQTGPTLTVKVIDLTPAAGPPRMTPKAVAVAAPTAAKAAKAAKPVAAKAAPVISETRGIALKAVKDLMDQQQELRAQQDEQARHRRALLTISLVALALFLLLGGGFLWYTGRLHLLAQKTGDLAGNQETMQKNVDKLSENHRKLVEDTTEHFGKIEAEQLLLAAEQKALMSKIEITAKEILDQQAKLRGGMEKMKQELGATLDDLNRRMIAKPQEKLPVAVSPPPNAPVAKKSAARIEPGMKIDIIMRDGVNTYRGVLLSVNGTVVRVQTIPDPAAKPSEFDMKKVQAFQTRDGIFAFNESTGEFESAITYFKFNKSSAMFERADDQQEPYRSEDAQVQGAVTVRGIWGKGPGGDWVLGLPGAGSQAPPPMAAYQLKEIVTVKGTYTYDQSAQDYTFKPYTQLAAEAREKHDEFLRQLDEKQWERRKEAYKLGTDRLRAMAPYFWRRWW